MTTLCQPARGSAPRGWRAHPLTANASFVHLRWIAKTPIFESPLEPGSYLLTITAAGKVDVRYPILLARGEQLRIDVPIPSRSEIPPGFVYIPKGRFLFGYGQDETLRKVFFATAPLHQVTLDTYLISQNETTYADWIEYLNTLSHVEKKKRTPNVARGSAGGYLELQERSHSSWTLRIQPQTTQYSVAQGDLLEYPSRTIRKRQNWQKLPLAGISYDDAQAFLIWLNTSGRAKGARLCTEHEWERAAKGADEREYPHGDTLELDDANFDETYHKAPAAWGPDEVGSHPISTSPFSIHDLVGNHWELTTSSMNNDEVVCRGGSYLFDSFVDRSTNRNVVEPIFRSNDVTLRICISWPQR